MSSVLAGNRAIIYSTNGDPARVLSAFSFPELPPPPPNTANIRFLLAPINPADINVIEGVYPARPEPDVSLSQAKDHPLFVGGNEGLGKVMDVGEGVVDLQKDDWVVMTKAQSGTWASAKNIALSDVLKVPKQGLSEAQAATITVRFFVVVQVPYLLQFRRWRRSTLQQLTTSCTTLPNLSKEIGLCKMVRTAPYVWGFICALAVTLTSVYFLGWSSRDSNRSCQGIQDYQLHS
jgi:hypothetical protein